MLKGEQLEAIRRRISENAGGLGTWSAIEAAKKLGINASPPEKGTRKSEG